MFELNIPIEDLAVDSRQPQLYVSGEVWITIDGHDFPGHGWTDEVLPFLGSLRAAIGEARSGDETDFYFWEGNFFVKLVPIPAAPDARYVEVFAVHDSADPEEGGTVEASCVCTLTELGDLLQGTIGELSLWAHDHHEAELLEFLSRMTSLPELT
ncbi:hypothetical protein AB0H00_11245 [Nocardia sp. NPDC023852]|uniref:hypothetical protein n=1 Tax=Nocardia sp. NPDC023852 TaxID=3154697 RepID=UPI0033ED13A3